LNSEESFCFWIINFNFCVCKSWNHVFQSVAFLPHYQDVEHKNWKISQHTIVSWLSLCESWSSRNIPNQAFKRLHLNERDKIVCCENFQFPCSAGVQCEQLVHLLFIDGLYWINIAQKSSLWSLELSFTSKGMNIRRWTLIVFLWLTCCRQTHALNLDRLFWKE